MSIKTMEHLIKKNTIIHICKNIPYSSKLATKDCIIFQRVQKFVETLEMVFAKFSCLSNITFTEFDIADGMFCLQTANINVTIS